MIKGLFSSQQAEMYDPFHPPSQTLSEKAATELEGRIKERSAHEKLAMNNAETKMGVMGNIKKLGSRFMDLFKKSQQSAEADGWLGRVAEAVATEGRIH